MTQRKHRTSGSERAFQIIECLVAIGEPATAYQIAKKLGAPLSTVYESIALLERLEILVRQGGEGKFYLGFKLHLYGLAYAKINAAEEVHRRESESLSRRTGRSVVLCVRDGDYIVVSMVVDGNDDIRVSVHPGTRMPLNWTASGFLLLGHLTPDERRPLFERAQPSPSGKAATDPEILERKTITSWERGYSIEPAESAFAITFIVAPVRDDQGHCRGTIGLLVPDSALEKDGDMLIREVMDSAHLIESHVVWSSIR
ncbi:MAG: IclR family transcriptional regulator [Planctomycetes bacterium]|nr:IclR family transcriptional regulator [Planctomycetota bacterium]